MLFDANERFHLGAPDWRHSAYGYLCDSARPSAARVRDFYEGAFARLPSDGRQDLKSRFRSRNSDHHLGAAAELVLHELMVRRGAAVELNPTVAGGRTPDLRVTPSQGPGFVLESKAIGSGVNLHLFDALDAIDGVASPTLRFQLRVRREPRRQMDLKTLRRDVQQFADNIASTAPFRDEAPFAQHPRLRIRQAEGDLDLYAHRRRRPGVGRNVGVVDVSASEFLTAEELRDAVRKKATKYAAIDEPLVVAVAVNRSFIQPSDVSEALFGRRLSGSSERDGTGVWRGPPSPQRQRLSGVLMFYGFRLWPRASTRVELIKNPWALRPVSGNPLGGDLASYEGGRVHRMQGATLGELLGLQDGWPGDD